MSKKRGTMKDIQAAIAIIDRKIGDLKDQARDFVKEVAALLKKVKPEKGEALKNQPKPKRIWVALKKVAGYSTFSIVWSLYCLLSWQSGPTVH